MTSATAQANPNIAFIKYWGNRDDALRLPANGSISMNLDGLYTRTTVSFQPSLAKAESRAEVVSENNFPTGAGIASSASAFAALALAASRAAGLDLSERELSRLARRGSGSACRSIPGGYVEWRMGTDDGDSYAVSITPPAHWPLVDCIAIVNETHKKTGSTEGHALASTSPLQAGRLADTPRRLELCRRAILERDFEALTAVIELDSDMMHGVMMTSEPALHYWMPASLEVMNAVRSLRAENVPACCTVDAGANVHVLCPEKEAQEITRRLRTITGVKDVLAAGVGGPAKLIEENAFRSPGG